MVTLPRHVALEDDLAGGAIGGGDLDEDRQLVVGGGEGVAGEKVTPLRS